MPSPRTRRGISRRTVLASVPLVQISTLAAAAPSIAPAFTSDQMKLIEVVVNRLIPADDLGPSAGEAGLPVYLARSFAGHLSSDRSAFSEGLAAIESAARARHNTAFGELSPAQQDEFLTAMEKNEFAGFRPDSRTFFNRIRQLTLEGMFGDPWRTAAIRVSPGGISSATPDHAWPCPRKTRGFASR